MNYDIRAIDQARATQMVIAYLTDDAEMFSHAVRETINDDRGGPHGVGASPSVFGTLCNDLSGLLRDQLGDDLVIRLRSLLAQQLAAAEVGADEISDATTQKRAPAVIYPPPVGHVPCPASADTPAEPLDHAETGESGRDGGTDGGTHSGTGWDRS